MSEILSSIQSLDFTILNFIQTYLKNPFLDSVMPYITHLASAGIIWIVLAIVLICIKKCRRSGLTITIALILCFILCNVIIKNLVARTRPFDINTMISLLITKPTDFSFPSGHTTASFAAAAALLFCKNRAIGIPALILAILVAFSRMYLYVHYPSDIAFGILLGIFIAAMSNKITKRIYKI